MSAGPLFGKLAIVTGAGSGIGRAVCQLLSRDGAKVIAADRNLEAAKTTVSSLKTESISLELDVSSLKSIEDAVVATKQQFKNPPTIVVNSAGITRDAYLLKMKPAEYDDVYAVNLRGTFLTTQKFVQAMIDNDVANGGSVINISSIVALTSNIGQCNYAAIKSGVISLTEVAAKEFGKFGVRVNAVLPGYINTPMTELMPDAIKQQVIQSCPLRRHGQPEEVAELIAFLASNKASYVNGAAIKVTGGLM